MDKITGQFLVASRYLRDPNFFRTVVLMVRHDSEGALGLVLNRPGDKRIGEVWEMTGHEPCDNSDLMFVGGPVPGPLMAVHTAEELSEEQIMPGIYFSTHRDVLNQIVREDRPFRLFVGHAGWGEGQLESEMEVGGWLITSPKPDEIWADPSSIWKTVTSRIGLSISVPEIDPDDIPHDPRLN